MDRVTVTQYQVATANDVNDFHQLTQDYLEKIVQGFSGGGDGSNNDFLVPDPTSLLTDNGPAGGSPNPLQVDVEAQWVVLSGRVIRVPLTSLNLTPDAPNPNPNPRRFWIYFAIREDEFTENRDIANPATGIKVPTPVVTRIEETLEVLVVQTGTADPENPPATGAVAPGQNRLSVLRFGYVDYLEGSPSGTWNPNTAAQMTVQGNVPAPSVAFNDLTDASGAPGSAGDVARSDGANIVISTLQADDIAQFTGMPGSADQILKSNGTTISPVDAPEYIHIAPKFASGIKSGGSGTTDDLVWTAAEAPDQLPPQKVVLEYNWSSSDSLARIEFYLVASPGSATYDVYFQEFRIDHTTAPFAAVGVATSSIASVNFNVTTAITSLSTGEDVEFNWQDATRTLTVNITSSGENGIYSWASNMMRMETP